MPELPEVEIMRRNIEAWGAGRRLLRFVPLDPKWSDMTIQPGPIRSVSRRGKALVWDIGDWSLLIHFRMTGKIVKMNSDRRFVRARFELSGGMTLGFLDQRRFADLLVMTPKEALRHLEEKNWGPEPWPEALTASWWEDRFGTLKMAIKPALMRADLVAGIGNILASEICHAAGIAPQKPCKELITVEWERLAASITPLIDRVIELESGPEIAYVNQGGGGGQFLVYGRLGAPCLRCQDGLIEVIKQSGRSTFFCPICQ